MLGHKNPDPLSLSKQDENTDYSIVLQKFKHCNFTSEHKPSTDANVKHIVNFIESLKDQTPIIKAGIMDGVKTGYAEKFVMNTTAILDEIAVHRFLFLNEDFTIERGD